MLQRIQSIYLLLSAGLSSLCWFFPFANGGNNDSLFADGLLTASDNLALIVLVVAVIALPAIAIFLYKNYKLQKTLVNLSLLAALGLIATAAFLAFTSGVSDLGVGISLFVPLAGLLFGFLALRGIQHDENIIKSSNRIR